MKKAAWVQKVFTSYLNMLVEFFQYLFIGKLFIFLVRKFPPAIHLSQRAEFSKELFDCDLCLGFWTYLALSPFFKIKIDTIENKAVRNTVLAAVASFLMFLISAGWRENFENLVIVNGTE